jgi:hypothetical protein
MTTPHLTHGPFVVALLASFSVACASNPPTPSATAANATPTTATRASTPPTATTPLTTQSLAPLTTNTAIPPIPATPHFAPADTRSRSQLEAEARALALQRQRDDLAALTEAGKLTNGYTDSIKHWSISTAKKPR